MRPATHPGEPRLVTPDEGASIDVPARHGTCAEAQYLQWTERCRRLLEFTDGRLDILPMPTGRHQVIVRFLLLALLPHALELGGTFGIRRVSMFSLRSSATRWSTTASRGIP